MLVNIGHGIKLPTRPFSPATRMRADPWPSETPFMNWTCQVTMWWAFPISANMQAMCRLDVGARPLHVKCECTSAFGSACYCTSTAPSSVIDQSVRGARWKKQRIASCMRALIPRKTLKGILVGRKSDFSWLHCDLIVALLAVLCNFVACAVSIGARHRHMDFGSKWWEPRA